MVQINRGSVLASRTRAIRRGLSGLMRFTLMSAAIPLVFIIRHYMSPAGGFLMLKPTIHKAFQEYNPQYDARLLTLLQRVEYSGFFQERTSTEYGSVAELYYCSFPSFPSQWRKQQPTGAYFWLNFTAWASPVLNQTIDNIHKRKDLESLPDTDAMEKELLLQLLEIYAQDQPGLCDYQQYQPTIPTTDSPDRKAVTHSLARLSKPPQLVISIVAHRDVPQLQRLIQALPTRRTVILIHLERPRDENARDLEQSVREWAQDHHHVHVLSFGSVIYGTGSVTHIQWRILHWLLQEVQLSFDYFVTLDGASFPLQSPSDLSKRILAEPEGVWLGPMLHQGHDPTTSSASPPLHLLRQKRLLYTTTHPQKDTSKFTQRLPRRLMSHQVIPESIGHALQYKSHSGNTAVYHRSVLQKLVDSAKVQQLMALSKYSVNCCLEEHVWVAALVLTGLPVPQKSAVVQGYGGTSATCESSKHNAIWTRNATICYKVEDALLVHELAGKEPLLALNQTAGGHVMNGNATATLLRRARELGFLFVRKFESSHAGSMDLLRYIQESIW